MGTDLDYDDAIGQRLRELREPGFGATTGAWDGVEHRRRTHRTRRIVASVGAAVLVVIAAAAVAVAINDPDGKRVEVVHPAPEPVDAPIVEVLPRTETTSHLRIVANPPTTLEIEVQVEADFEDWVNAEVTVCFPWAGGETCDPAVRATPVSARLLDGNAGVWHMTMPTWVNTPNGLQSCTNIKCRIVADDFAGHRYASSPIRLSDPGPRPDSLIDVASAGHDGVVRVTSDGLTADPSYTAWANNAAPERLRDVPPGYMTVCAWHHLFRCDNLVKVPQPAFDGKPFVIDIPTNRMLFTPEGWVDCVQVTCAVSLSRTVNVEEGDGGVGSSTAMISFVPYRLPADTPAETTPTLTVDLPPDPKVGDVVTITAHDLPPHADPEAFRGMGSLGQCTSDDLRRVDDCRYQMSVDVTDLPNHSIQARIPLLACGDARGCYFALQEGDKGYPEIAKTARFHVKGVDE
jgi:hypothetical protein